MTSSAPTYDPNGHVVIDARRGSVTEPLENELLIATAEQMLKLIRLRVHAQLQNYLLGLNTS